MSTRSQARGTIAYAKGLEAGLADSGESNPYEAYSDNARYWRAGYEDGAHERKDREAREPDARMHGLLMTIRPLGAAVGSEELTDAIADALELIWEKLK